MFEVEEASALNIKHLIFAYNNFHLNFGHKLILFKFRSCENSKSRTINLMHGFKKEKACHGDQKFGETNFKGEKQSYFTYG